MIFEYFLVINKENKILIDHQIEKDVNTMSI